MYRFGPSGIPLSCKGRTLKDGIEDVHELGLTALEYQLVRIQIEERYVGKDEEGKRFIDLVSEFPLEIVRKTNGKEIIMSKRSTVLEKGDLLRTLNMGLAKTHSELTDLGEVAKDLDIQLSVHTSYYVDLLGGDEYEKKSLENIRLCGLIANLMDAYVVVTHLGPYRNLSSKRTISALSKRLKKLSNWFIQNDINNIKIGLETSGRQEIFGSVDEILTLCTKVPNTIPVLNFAHIHARENGSLKTKENFQALFDKVKTKLDLNENYYTHFSGVEYENGNEKRYTPIKRGDLRFEELAECILDNNFSITIICDSPLLEHDAMYMKVILERIQTKRYQKSRRGRRR